MADLEALLQFNRKRVSNEMIDFLAATTNSVIHVQSQDRSPGGDHPLVSLTEFIRGLVIHSNVQTPTLMSTAVYLAKLRAIIPATVHGIETTRHRIFLGCLIVAAKNLNDSSPLNRHWASYTNGLLDAREVNTLERELLEYFDWNIRITMQDLLTCLAPFLAPIKAQILAQRQDLLYFNLPTLHQSKAAYQSDVQSRSSSSKSIPSLFSSATISTMSTKDSRESGRTPLLSSSRSAHMHRIEEESYNYHQPKLSTSRSEKIRVARPIIIKSGLPTPVEHSSKRFGMRSDLVSMFR
ncbi:LANO_0B05996g1_1 [Lachancea nothofagi CBS 11611]|uniref:LANO_0B05996g1_1 n=1 Tax=Lachancea nothofagi CBS 11611 TaxID=1266666 RepID=A0A1G4IZ36_9SACH|nr:LANO_0B05996g1_1 [Lachancea nothofagi CBS 11611]